MAEDQADDDKDYEIGYGKPPIATRWKPGQSGNPNGRPKRERDPNKVMLDALMVTVPVRVSGRVKHMTKLELLTGNLVNDAIKGNPTARRLVADTLRKMRSEHAFMDDEQLAKFREDFDIPDLP